MDEALVHKFVIAMNDPGHCTIDGYRYSMPYGPPTGQKSPDGYILTFGEAQLLHQGMCACHPNCDTVVFNVERVPRKARSFADAVERGYLIPA
jgi:hypothetical protein